MNPHRGETSIELAGSRYQVKLTLDGIAKIEQSTGCSVIKIAQKLSEGDLTSKDIVSILMIAIRSGGNDVTNNDIAKIVWQAGLIESMRICGELLTIALDTGNNEGNA